MKLDSTSILLAAYCAAALTLTACSMRAGGASPKVTVSAPAPAAPPVEAVAELPLSVPQTQVTLPKPQPIQAEALATLRQESPAAPEPANQPPRPARNPIVRSEPRPQATAPAPPVANPPAPARRLRPVESPAERKRLLDGIGARQHQIQDVLARARTRPLSAAEKSAADRIQAFLEQTEAALKDQDLQQAEALSNRAFLLSQDLNSGK